MGGVNFSGKNLYNDPEMAYQKPPYFFLQINESSSCFGGIVMIISVSFYD